MKKLQIIGLITALVLTSGLVGCKEQPVQEEIEDPETTESYDYKPTAERIGSEFWEFLKARDITSMANLSSDNTRDDFIFSFSAYFSNKDPWENDFFDTHLDKFEVIEGMYESNDDTAKIDYTLIISNHDYQYYPGDLQSYKVSLKFDLENEEAFVSNPGVAIDVYKDILNDYDRYLINTKVFPEETYPEETEPEETTPPETTVETTVATETETIESETEPSETTIEETAASELEPSETTKKKKKKKKEVVISDDENEPGEY